MLFRSIIIDIYIAVNVGGIYMVISGFILFIVILSVFYNKFKRFIIYLILLLFGLIILELNEYFNCKVMLEQYPQFPFHILIELYGLFLFYILSNKLLTLDK